MLKIGDSAFDTLEQANVQRTERIEVWGDISYKIFNSATGHVYKATEELLNPEGSTICYFAPKTSMLAFSGGYEFSDLP